MREWRSSALTLFDSVYQILKPDIEKLVDNHLGRWDREGLRNQFCMSHVLTIWYGFGAHLSTKDNHALMQLPFV